MLFIQSIICCIFLGLTLKTFGFKRIENTVLFYDFFSKTRPMWFCYIYIAYKAK